MAAKTHIVERRRSRCRPRRMFGYYEIRVAKLIRSQFIGGLRFDGSGFGTRRPPYSSAHRTFSSADSNLAFQSIAAILFLLLNRINTNFTSPSLINEPSTIVIPFPKREPDPDFDSAVHRETSAGLRRLYAHASGYPQCAIGSGTKRREI